MVSISVVFYMLMILFALVGGVRGWAREILVTFAVILSMFIITVLERFVPFVRVLGETTPVSLFWMRSAILLSLVFFGYQTPNIPRIAQSGRFARERLQDILLGFFLGAINGFLVWGTMWWFLDDAAYPFEIISAPDEATVVGQEAIRLVRMLPPVWLMAETGTPIIYFAVAIAFVFVLVVFI
ncbi:MAG: hypothetical protein AB1453_04990 [Chloroflexota bacterium]|jgi:uncharacterized membrane protein required for colicin V production